MSRKDKALIRYLEFNLIALVESIKPFVKEDTNEEELFGMASLVLDEMKQSLVDTAGIGEESR